jgi:hypothetical protein
MTDATERQDAPGNSVDDEFRDLPQFSSRRRFIVWAISAGLCSERRLTEAIIAEVEREDAAA